MALLSGSQKAAAPGQIIWKGENMQEKKWRITVFTPAYNRRYMIGKLYESLQKQSYRDFEWVVVDDGSVDDTQQYFEDICRQSTFPIHYVKQENGGKHRAINRGVQEASGELFLIVDSDDYLTEDALERIDRAEKSIPPREKEKFAGVCGLKIFENGEIIGTGAGKEILDITTLQREAYGIVGDKAEVYYLDVMRKYPFPTFEGEKFVTECVVWDRIAADGLLMRFTRDPLIVCQYLPDGLTSNAVTLYQKNPRGYGLFISQRRKYHVWNLKELREQYLDFYYSMRDRMSMKEMADCLHTEPLLLGTEVFLMRIWRRLSGG